MKNIMFNDRYGLTQAVIDLIKTNTRRAERSLDVLPLYYNPLITEFLFEYKDGIVIGRRFFKGSHVETYHLKPRYKVGEVVAVAQSYSNAYCVLRNKCGKKVADDWGCNVFDTLGSIPPLDKRAGWTNKMFVLAALMPHRIRITDIKVERLQDISNEDCMKEGVFKYEKPPLHHENDMYAPWPPYVKAYKYDYDNLQYRCNARAAFKTLIDRISGKGTWERNPWVYAYEFELIK